MKRPAPAKRGREKKLPTAAAVGSFAFKQAGTPPAFEALLTHYLAALGLPRAEVALLLCGDAQSRTLNRIYRGKDSATDILSFPSQEGRVAPGFKGHLGDLALNLSYAWRRRGRFSESFEGELAFLLLHGLCHLVGVHHDTPSQERRMEALMRRHFPPPDVFLSGLKKTDKKRSWSH